MKSINKNVQKVDIAFAAEWFQLVLKILRYCPLYNPIM